MANSLDRQACIEVYFKLGLKYTEIAYLLENRHGFNMSVRHLKRLLRNMNLYRRRYSDLEHVITFIQAQLQGSGQLLGYRMMHTRCREQGYSVRKEDVRLILKDLDPAGVTVRRSRRLVRRSYNVPGPNHLWHLDGYDKLKPFGLCISGCIDGFSRKIIWLNVYNTNNNPSVIGGYFLEAVKEHGGCPRVIRGDFGTENCLVRDFQNYFRRFDYEDSTFAPYIDGPSTANQRIEGWWGILRRQCLHFWIELFKVLQDEGLYRGDFLDKNLVGFCFTSMIQLELDRTADTWNSHTIRPSANRAVPHGRPNVMHYVPSLWQAEDRLCNVNRADIDLCSQRATFRSPIPCDGDIYHLCAVIMGRDNLKPSSDFSECVDLYLHLRHDIKAMLSV